MAIAAETWQGIAFNPLDRQALRRRLRRRFPRLTPDDIEDLIQEAHLRLWSLGRHRRLGARSTLAFVTRIAYNAAIDAHRQQQILRLEYEGDPGALERAAEAPGPEDRTALTQELESLARFVANLPPRCREVFVLCKVECLPHKRVAAQMGIAVHTVEQHLRKALGRLRTYWGAAVSV